MLHAKPYRDSSLLVDLFSSEHGRIKVIARSARGPRSRFRGRLQPFMPLTTSWSGRTELKSLTHCECAGLPINLSGQALVSGFYLNELLYRLLRTEEPATDLFHAYQHTLQALCDVNAVQSSLRYFELLLLQELGYGLNLYTDANTHDAIDKDKHYAFTLQLGFHESLGIENRFTVSGEALIAWRDHQLETPEHCQAVKRISRYVLSHYLGNQPLKTRELF